jgi:hypothetical protein
MQGSKLSIFLPARRHGVSVETMSAYRLGWPDLLLVIAWLPALTGHFYVLMALLALYAVLYHRATHRHPQ